MDEYEFADAMVGLPDLFADRITAEDLDAVRDYANVGEWGEEADLLIACLRESGATITLGEHETLARLLTEMRQPTTALDHLVDGSQMTWDAFVDLLCRLTIGQRHRIHDKPFRDVTGWIARERWEDGVRELAASIHLFGQPLYQRELADLQRAWTYLDLDTTPLAAIPTIPAGHSPWGQGGPVYTIALCPAYLNPLKRLAIGLRHRIPVKAFLDVTSWMATGHWDNGVRELAASIYLSRVPLYRNERAALQHTWTRLGLDRSELARIPIVPAGESAWGAAQWLPLAAAWATTPAEQEHVRQGGGR